MKFLATLRARRWRPLKFIAAGGVLLLASFLLAFYLFFPASALRERVEQEFARHTGGELRMADLSLLFPPGLRADTIVVTGLGGRDRLEASSLAVKPAWATLFGANPGVNFLARLEGGVLEGKALKNGDLEARASRIAFDESLAAGSALRIAGTLAQGEFSGRAFIQPETETVLNLTLQGVRMTGMEGMGVTGGTTSLGTVTLRATGKGNALRIDTVSAEGGALEVSGNGSLFLAQPIARSRVNLTLTLRPGGELDPNLRDLLGLFAQATGDGNYRLRLTGTLATPVFAM